MEISAKILQSPIFRGIEKSEFEEMRHTFRMRQRSFEKNTVIFHTGELVREMGIIIWGSVNIENIDLWGNKSILSNVTAGQAFAETYALSHEPLMVDAVAAEDCGILFMNLSILTSEQKNSCTWHVKILKNMLAITAQKNLILSNRIFCTSAKTIRERLLSYLSAQAVKNGNTTFQIPFNRQQLADYLNLDRSALSKELGRMRDEGMIEFWKNQFTLKPNHF